MDNHIGQAIPFLLLPLCLPGRTGSGAAFGDRVELRAWQWLGGLLLHVEVGEDGLGQQQQRHRDEGYQQ